MKNSVNFHQLHTAATMIFVSFIVTVLVIGKGEGLNISHTYIDNGSNLQQRLNDLEKQLVEERKERFVLQAENHDVQSELRRVESELKGFNESFIQLLNKFQETPKQIQNIETQIRGVLLSIHNLDTKHNLDTQKVLATLGDIQSSLNDVASNESYIMELQRHLKEKQLLLSNMINMMKLNQTNHLFAYNKLKTSLESLTVTERTLGSSVSDLQNRQNSLQSQINDATAPIIFLAIPKMRNVSGGFWLKKLHWFVNPTGVPERTVNFHEVKINVGGGYNNNTGVFTCPSTGYYTFHWSLASTNITWACTSAILKNGNEVIGNEVGGNLATFHINRNDRVWIKAKVACTFYPMHSSFSGFKIF